MKIPKRDIIFSDRLIDLLKKHNITQRELARKTGVSSATISRYISDSRIPRIDILEKIANFFKVPIEYLLGDELNCKQRTSKDFVSRNDFFYIKCVILGIADTLSTEEKFELISILSQNSGCKN